MSASVLIVQIADRCQSVEEKVCIFAPRTFLPPAKQKKKIVVYGSGCRINRR